MWTVAFDKFGGPDVLHMIDREMPRPNPGEAVVEVMASTVAPTDIMMRDGRQASLMSGLKPPYVAGTEFAGVVHSLGDASDSRLSVGEPVNGHRQRTRPAGGSQSQYVCVPMASVVPISPDIDLVEAATFR